MSFIAKRKPIRPPDNLRRSRIGYRKSTRPCGIELPADWLAYGAAARALRAVACCGNASAGKDPRRRGFARRRLLRAANRGRQRLAQQRGFTEEAVVAKTPPDSGKRTIIGGRKAQIGPFSGMRDAARKTLRQNPRSENCATGARLPAESPTTDYRRSARVCPLFSNKGGANAGGGAIRLDLDQGRA